VETVFVKALFDVDCEWEGLPPAYRVYVNDQLFSERTWIWTDRYLTEILQIQAQPGRYRVHLEKVGHSLATFFVSNPRIEHGPAIWTKKGTVIEISNEST
jgi:hypothetical protein